MFKLRKQHCVDCHFFVGSMPTPSGEPHSYEISASDRKWARDNNFVWSPPMSKLGCSFLVWDERYDLPREDRFEQIVLVNRRNFCFWWRYHPGMLLPAAKLLQEREAKDRTSNRDRRLTLAGLWIASLALLANVWLTVAKEIKLWPFK